jgi:ATP-dependent Clp protease ATP-binding subunit ClpC
VQRDLEDSLAEKMLYGEVGPGQIVVVDVDTSDSDTPFTFKGIPKSELPDAPPPVEEPVTGTGG